MTKLLIADDHDLVRETIADYLRQQAGFDVDTARSLDQALELEAKNANYDIVFLDYSMPGMDGLSGLAKMRAQSAVPVAILSGTAPTDVAQRAVWMGAAGFVPKTLSPSNMVGAIAAMTTGQIYLPDSIAPSRPLSASPVRLTPRETDVLRGLIDGKSNKEIARDLDIQEVTVKLHVKTLSRKLNARNRTHAAMVARDLGLI